MWKAQMDSFGPFQLPWFLPSLSSGGELALELAEKMKRQENLSKKLEEEGGDS